MNVKNDAVQKLYILTNGDNFTGEKDGLYTGVHDPVLRANLNSTLNSVIQVFIKTIENKATKEQYIDLVRISINKFDRSALDSEDAERVAINFERIMDCVGLEDSDGVLNKWMYGFNPK